MKRLLALLLLAVMTVSLSACGADSQKDKTTGKENSADSDVSSVNTNDEQQKEEQKEEQDVEKEEEASAKIDIEKLRKIEENDDFALSIVSKSGVKGAFDNGSPVVDLNGEDGIVIKLKNDTDAKVQNVTILILCTDENGSGRDLGALSSFNLSSQLVGNKPISYSNHVKVMGTESADLDAGAEKEYGIQCKLENIKNVNAIVYSYVDASGKEIINQNYENWLSNTYEIPSGI